jgi:peptide deformylase
LGRKRTYIDNYEAMILTDEETVRSLGLAAEEVYKNEIEDLKSILEKELLLSEKSGVPGIGLACPQIGIPKKMAIIRMPGKTFFYADLVNPVIEEKYDLSIFDGEGCLSFPGLSGRTQRYQEIKVKNLLGFPKKFIATGLPAVCIQHEIDHLHGIVLPDLIKG